MVAFYYFHAPLFNFENLRFSNFPLNVPRQAAGKSSYIFIRNAIDDANSNPKGISPAPYEATYDPTTTQLIMNFLHKFQSKNGYENTGVRHIDGFRNAKPWDAMCAIISEGRKNKKTLEVALTEGIEAFQNAFRLLPDTDKQNKPFDINPQNTANVLPKTGELLDYEHFLPILQHINQNSTKVHILPVSESKELEDPSTKKRINTAIRNLFASKVGLETIFLPVNTGLHWVYYSFSRASSGTQNLDTPRITCQDYVGQGNVCGDEMVHQIIESAYRLDNSNQEIAKMRGMYSQINSQRLQPKDSRYDDSLRSEGTIGLIKYLDSTAEMRQNELDRLKTQQQTEIQRNEQVSREFDGNLRDRVQQDWMTQGWIDVKPGQKVDVTAEGNTLKITITNPISSPATPGTSSPCPSETEIFKCTRHVGTNKKLESLEFNIDKTRFTTKDAIIEATAKTILATIIDTNTTLRLNEPALTSVGIDVNLLEQQLRTAGFNNIVKHTPPPTSAQPATVSSTAATSSSSTVTTSSTSATSSTSTGPSSSASTTSTANASSIFTQHHSTNTTTGNPEPAAHPATGLGPSN